MVDNAFSQTGLMKVNGMHVTIKGTTIYDDENKVCSSLTCYYLKYCSMNRGVAEVVISNAMLERNS